MIFDCKIKSMDCSRKSPFIAEKISKRAQRNIQFICKQLLRFAKMSINERIAYLRKYPKNVDCSFPHPSGKGALLYGTLGHAKLDDLTDLALDLDRGLGRRVGRQRAENAVKDVFVRRVLQEELEANEETAALLLQDAFAALKESLVVTEHYFPCVFFSGGSSDEFSVGPITFIRRKKFFQDKKIVFRQSIEIETAAHIMHVNTLVDQGFYKAHSYNEAESRQLVRSLQARAIKIYRSYPWVACIRVVDCDEKISQERAVRAVDMALHVVRILLGAQSTKKLRLAWSQSESLQSAHLYADAGNVIKASLSWSVLEPAGASNWHEALMRCSTELGVLGSALRPIANPVEIYHLHQRLIDAIHWFGDAATDSNASSSIVKYVSVIERLFFGVRANDRKKTFANRIASVLKAFGCDEGVSAHMKACKVYQDRSNFLHGEYSPTKDVEQKTVCDAENLSRMCLLCSTQLYPMMLQAFGNPDSVKLDEVMSRISIEGVGWLARAAGYSSPPSQRSSSKP